MSIKIALELPPFKFEISTNIALVDENIQQLYPSQSRCESVGIFDYPLHLVNQGLLRRIFRKQARFLCDDREPFKPLNFNQAFAMLEWGMNWTVASHEMNFLMIHSAVLAKEGKAILFPAPPGSGKSTITAHLAFNGWQLLSDEMALVNLNSCRVTPFVRPICLKNQSISLVKSWFPEARYSTIATDTHKGDVIHVSPPDLSWSMAKEEAEIVGIVYPNYKSGEILTIEELSHAASFIRLSDNAFNYNVLGNSGVSSLIKVVEGTKSYAIRHSDLHDLQAFLEEEIF